MQRAANNLADPVLHQVESLQERIADLTARLDHAERLATLGTIAGLIAHEFNNILTPVMSYAQLALANDEDSDLARKALQKAADGSEQASQIAAAILGFVRTDPGQSGGIGAVQARVAADLHEAIESALACIGRDLEKDRIELTIDVPRGTSAAIRPVSLRHIVVNLVLNARNAMLPRGGSLTIRTRRCERAPAAPADAVVAPAPSAGELWSAPNDAAAVGGAGHDGFTVLSIEDTGCGVVPERLANIFEPYRSSHQAQPSPVGGTGLGLTTCLRLVAEVGGSLWIQSRPGRGTTVSAVLPTAAAAARTEPLRQVA